MLPLGIYDPHPVWLNNCLIIVIIVIIVIIIVVVIVVGI
jgi:hypothetical protein